jgi:hypothetical protein
MVVLPRQFLHSEGFRIESHFHRYPKQMTHDDLIAKLQMSPQTCPPIVLPVSQRPSAPSSPMTLENAGGEFQVERATAERPAYLRQCSPCLALPNHRALIVPQT